MSLRHPETPVDYQRLLADPNQLRVLRPYTHLLVALLAAPTLLDAALADPKIFELLNPANALVDALEDAPNLSTRLASDLELLTAAVNNPHVATVLAYNPHAFDHTQDQDLLTALHQAKDPWSPEHDTERAGPATHRRRTGAHAAHRHGGLPPQCQQGVEHTAQRRRNARENTERAGTAARPRPARTHTKPSSHPAPTPRHTQRETTGSLPVRDPVIRGPPHGAPPLLGLVPFSTVDPADKRATSYSRTRINRVANDRTSSRFTRSQTYVFPEMARLSALNQPDRTLLTEVPDLFEHVRADSRLAGSLMRTGSRLASVINKRPDVLPLLLADDSALLELLATHPTIEQWLDEDPNLLPQLIDNLRAAPGTLRQLLNTGATGDTQNGGIEQSPVPMSARAFLPGARHSPPPMSCLSPRSRGKTRPQPRGLLRARMGTWSRPLSQGRARPTWPGRVLWIRRRWGRTRCWVLKWPPR
ncbi:hypothetical protein NKH18_15080 [Streptomyces sp. M10(2022)]